MVKRAGSFGSRTRQKLWKSPRQRGKVSVNKILQSFKDGEAVIVKHESTIHKGMPHPRFKGRGGIVLRKQGEAYLVKVRDKNAYKTLVVKPVHLLKVTA